MNQDGPADSSPIKPELLSSPAWMHGVIAITLLGLLVWFITDRRGALDSVALDVLDTQIASLEGHPSTDIVVQPIRETVLTDPPLVFISSFDRTCQECHKLFVSRPVTARQLIQHTEIRLEHGLNNRCFNCHDRENRDEFVLHDGRTVPFTSGELLCAKCHGPTYRDWERRIHGRVDGSWETTNPAARQRKCTECHDPHQPAFGQWPLIRGPQTLRVESSGQAHGEGDGDGHGPGEELSPNPLRRYRQQEVEQHEPAPLQGVEFRHSPTSDESDEESDSTSTSPTEEDAPAEDHG